ncbi:hypothetical protein ARNL5_00912 [Anaerolineae bacterium]|nr:LamG domain-containing protein [Sandaracinaceae bacterium]CAG0961104.1 hypothetical protein ARNL5_00912 [Anaerolineae bacterium]
MPARPQRVIPRRTYDFSALAAGSVQRFLLDDRIEVGGFAVADLQVRVHSASIAGGSTGLVRVNVRGDGFTWADPATSFQGPIERSVVALANGLTAPRYVLSDLELRSGALLVEIEAVQNAASGQTLRCDVSVDLTLHEKGRPTPWTTPGCVSGLRAWYRADAGTELASGPAISSWTDLASGLVLSQATSTKRPKIVAASSYFNGQITHSFTTGSQQYVQSATGATLVSQPNTIYAVCRAANVASTRVVCASNNASAAQQLYYSTTPDWKFSAGTVLSTGNTTTGVPLGICAVANGTSGALYIHNFATPAGASNVGTNALGGFSIGANYTPAGYFDGEIAEILVYEGAHSAATRALLASYFNRRYGLSITT